MSIITTDSQFYTNIANAIRSKNSSATTYLPSEMAAAILNLPTGSGTDVSDTTATAADVLNGKYFHVADGTKTLGTLKFDWMGENPELVQQVYSYSAALSATNYASWTPTSTATTMKASATLTTPKPVLDLATYDYILLWLSDVDVVYSSAWSANAASCMREICLYNQAIFQRPSSVTTATEGTFNYNATQQNGYSIYWCEYYSSATARSMAYTTYSPWYISAINAPTFSSTSDTDPTLTIKTPTMSARCSGTYFSTANAAKVDQTKTTVNLVGYLYRVKRGTSTACSEWHVLTNLYNNPL